MLGFFFSVMVIYFINYNYAEPENSTYVFNASITTAICVVIIPLLDTLRIFIIRMVKGKSPFAPDKSHLHHALMRMGLRHSQTAIVLGLINIMFIAIAILLNDLRDIYLLPIVLLMGVVVSVVIDQLIIRKLKGTRNN